jgi:uncharacterized protein YPO0396
MIAIEGLAPAGWHGYRLVKLELFNWGTFDSTNGTVHSVKPEGATTLLIGQNGSGKSTMVDALLTLLVRPVVRNYNVAAGAQKQERDERSYIKGACGRLGRDDDNRAEIQYLRRDGGHYTAILGCFRNELGAAITLAQVLFLDGENAPQKVYCFAEKEMSIAEQCAGLTSTERLRQQMEKRGFRATQSYTDYHKWFARATGVRAKAMDIFNQTVAVKDIQSLNKFIREHMLEAKPWAEKIDALQNHVTQLSEAHRSLVRVRDQYQLLLPIESKGKLYRDRAAEVAAVRKILDGADSFFRSKTIELFEPECLTRADELNRLGQSRGALEGRIDDANEQLRTIRNELEQAGGQRLREIPHLIRRAEGLAERTRASKRQLQEAIAAADLTQAVHCESELAQLHAILPAQTEKVNGDLDRLDAERNKGIVKLAGLRGQEEEDQRELEALAGRQGNLPVALTDIRRQICEHLSLKDADLPFAAELIAVRPEARDWQASIEMVLRGFGLSLLVPTRYYGAVTAYIDRNRLADRHGAGQRLVYLKIGEINANAARNTPPLHPQSMVRKLNLRDGHLLIPWLRHELEVRHNLICCQTIEEFQQAHGMAMTRQRHIKRNDTRHEKDDRDQTADPRRFVLGWDNREKQRALAEGLIQLRGEANLLDQQIKRLATSMETLRIRRTALGQIAQVADFDAIDHKRHEREIEELLQEKEALEAGSAAVQLLKARLAQAKETFDHCQKDRDDLLLREEAVRKAISEGELALANARGVLAQRRASGILAPLEASFADISAALGESVLTPANLFEHESRFLRDKRAELDRRSTELDPIRYDVCTAMNQYLRHFREDRTDLDARVESLDSFFALCEQVRHDDLPRHEARFKERLNEKVTQELGLLNGALNTEKAEIESKIEQLNGSLRQLEYRRGTYMRLEPRPVRDREIAEFTSGLRDCLSNSFEGTFEANEARFLKIEKFLARLRDEARWREKVTDVRRWFDFAARELEEGTNVQRAYYEDSAGQSGGEKAKLAFTILVAAIAYQYDIDPSHPISNRFGFVVVDEMFSKVDDQYSEYALRLFAQFGLQLLIVAPLDAKARVTEPFVGCYLHAVKDANSSKSEIFSMTAREFEEAILVGASEGMS